MSDLIISQTGPIGSISLNRSQALNALTYAMICSMAAQIAQFNHDKAVEVIVLSASPGKAFCAGGDIRWLYEAGKEKNPDQKLFFKEEYALNLAIARSKKPIVSLMNGMTLGGGVGIGLHAAFPIASPKFLCAMPETGIGFFPDVGASFLFQRAPLPYALYLGLTGARVSAASALTLSLIKGIVPAEAFPALTDALLAADWQRSDKHQAVAETLTPFFLQQTAPPIEEQLYSAFAQPSVEAIFETLAAEKSAWAEGTLSTLKEKSPLSLKVTHALLTKTRNLSLEQCLRIDLCLAKHFMDDPDFYEGVRALIVDKDKKPKWRPNTVAEVSEARVAAFFEG